MLTGAKFFRTNHTALFFLFVAKLLLFSCIPGCFFGHLSLSHCRLFVFPLCPQLSYSNPLLSFHFLGVWRERQCSGPWPCPSSSSTVSHRLAPKVSAGSDLRNSPSSWGPLLAGSQPPKRGRLLACETAKACRELSGARIQTHFTLPTEKNAVLWVKNATELTGNSRFSVPKGQSALISKD